MFVFGNKGFNSHMNFVSLKRSNENFTKLHEFNCRHKNIVNFIITSIFSITNSADKTHKEITILGIKIRLKRKNHNPRINLFTFALILSIEKIASSLRFLVLTSSSSLTVFLELL